MVCPGCNKEIPDDAVFCPECGAKQEQASFCPNCGSKLGEGAVFCPECGNRITGEEPINAPESFTPETSVHKGHGGRVVAVILAVALVMIGIAAFFVWRYVNHDSKSEKIYVQQETTKSQNTNEKKDKKQDKKEDKNQVTEADIVATRGENCSLEGTIKTDASGKKVLGWNEGIRISGLDESGKTVLAKDVTNVYINDIGLEDGVLDAVASNKKVVLGGQIYFIRDAIYIKANKITDESGNVIENNKDKNSQVIRENIAYDYIIPYSSTVLLRDGDVAGLSLQEINYAKNEIYARHGRRFKSQELQSYFNSKSWYNGTVDPDSFSDSMMSEIEKKNVTYLNDVEFGINPNGYQLDAR